MVRGHSDCRSSNQGKTAPGKETRKIHRTQKMLLDNRINTLGPKNCFYQENIMPVLRNIRNRVKGFSQRIKDTTNHSDHSEIQIQ